MPSEVVTPSTGTPRAQPMVLGPWRFRALWALMALFGTAALAMIFGGVGLIGYQLLHWLRTGIWMRFPLRLLWDHAVPPASFVGSWLIDPQGEWVGLHQLVVLLLRFPLSIVLLFVGVKTLTRDEVVAVGDRVEFRRRIEQRAANARS